MKSSVMLFDEMRWDQIFRILSMERCYSFLNDMGLPANFVAKPERLTFHARNYLQNSNESTSAWLINLEDYMVKRRHNLEDKFTQLATDYDQETTNLFHDWCYRYVIDYGMANGLSAWGELFSRLCGLTRDTTPTVMPPISSEVLTYICGVIYSYLNRDVRQEVRHRIEIARSLPISEWEVWLEGQTRHAAGEGKILGAVEMTLYLVENIIDNHHTFQVWNSLNNRIASADRALLITWGHEQATALGIPIDCLHVPLK